tara:strand:+ start:2528 stop:2875 length:348 start_codon:yes stop_codon:yes gene_type:complete
MSFFDHPKTTHYGDDLDNLKTLSRKHMPYYSEDYDDNMLYYKTQRSKYVRDINRWLSKPLYENDNHNDVTITNAGVIKKMFNDINDAIEKNGFIIHDNKQFKEDFIHFMYTLSKL